MRLHTLLLLPLSLVAVGARPHKAVTPRQANADLAAGNGTGADMLEAARTEFIPIPDLSPRSDIDPPHWQSARGVGGLGTGAFAGQGSGEARITALQHLLHARGHKVAIDGAWGPETSGAVSAFQSASGLDPDSIPGPATLGAMVDQVQQGSSGDIVSAAQVLLNANGANIAVDGDFGPASHSAAVAFQTTRGLDADGIVGQNTWTALFSAAGSPPAEEEPIPGSDAPAGGLPTPAAVLAGQATLLSKVELNQLGQPGRYANTAYCPPKEWLTWTCNKCNDGAPSEKTYLVYGGGGFYPPWYVIGNGGSVVVAVRGSAGLTWATNADARLVSPATKHFPGGSDLGGSDISVHGGFYNAFQDGIDKIMLAVKKALPDNGNRILVTGHSQGAAVATLIAAHLQASLPNAVVNLRAFAAPRSGNPEWANYVDGVLGDRARRITNFNDVVPNVPLMQMGYRHHSGEVWKTKDGQWILCKGQESAFCGMSKDATPRTIDSHMGPYPANVVMDPDCKK